MLFRVKQIEVLLWTQRFTNLKKDGGSWYKAFTAVIQNVSEKKYSEYGCFDCCSLVLPCSLKYESCARGVWRATARVACHLINKNRY